MYINCNIKYLGVRYNAEKKKVGNYYTTPIYRFRMKCHLCDNYIEIETDPKVLYIEHIDIYKFIIINVSASTVVVLELVYAQSI